MKGCQGRSTFLRSFLNGFGEHSEYNRGHLIRYRFHMQSLRRRWSSRPSLRRGRRNKSRHRRRYCIRRHRTCIRNNRHRRSLHVGSVTWCVSFSSSTFDIPFRAVEHQTAQQSSTRRRVISTLQRRRTQNNTRIILA